jgi:uncharacterized protein YqhQ
VDPRVPFLQQLQTALRLFPHLQLLPVLESGEETLVGGQAVLEGVMMRAPHSYFVSVRRPNGELATDEKPVHRMSEKYPIFRLPVLRGIGTLFQAMQLGVEALQFSANVSLEEENKGKDEKPTQISSWAMTLQVIFSIGFFFVAYKYLPLLLTDLLTQRVPALQNRILFGGVDGIIRLTIFLTFLFLLSRTKDIHRVFEYHGAEHKVVFNFESGRGVDVPTAQSFRTWHPRCGTSFLIVVMLISIPVYILVPVTGFLPQLAVRFLMLLPIAGLSYEIIRFAAKRKGSFLNWLTAPGLWLQRITTQPPDDRQVEVAIHSLNGAMALEEKQGGELVIA